MAASSPSYASLVAERRLERAHVRCKTSSAAIGAHWQEAIEPKQAQSSVRWPRDFTCSEPRIDERARSHVHQVLLYGAPDVTFTLRGGEVCLMGRDNWVSGLLSLGECADGECGCFRLTKPWVRASFARCVAECAAATLGTGKSVRYMTVGCGLLLTDLEVICALQAAGLTIESATFVDAGVDTFRFHGALTELARFLAPARVVAYPSTNELAIAVLEGRESSAHVLVHCDAAKIGKLESRSLASQALVPRGLAFRLTNHGARKAATVDVWHRRAAESDEAAALTAAALERARSLLHKGATIPHLLEPPATEAMLETLLEMVPVTKDGVPFIGSVRQVVQGLRNYPAHAQGTSVSSALTKAPPAPVPSTFVSKCAVCTTASAGPTGGRMPEFSRHSIR